MTLTFCLLNNLFNENLNNTSNTTLTNNLGDQAVV